jgi:hypothetical protein
MNYQKKKAKAHMAARLHFSGTLLITALLICCVNAPFSAHADEDTIDPFQTDTGPWMSYQRYKDNVKRGLIVPPDNVSAVQIPTGPLTSETNATVTPLANAETSGNTPLIAAPTRPLMLPVMPGMKKGLNVQVGTTIDDKANSAAKVVNLDTAPTLHLQSQNWQSAQEVAQSKSASMGEDKPLNVRMSFLPDSKITPVPSNHDKKPLTPAAASALTNNNKALPADLAACVAVLDSYKKKQLAALQSDRQTLTALQDAIAQLGLQKQLNFMTQGNSSLNAEMQNQPAKAEPSNAPKADTHP